MLTVVSLFSGCGGMDLGFEQAGFKIVWANDFDVDAQMTYRKNLGEIDPRDIRDIKSSEIPNADILLAGFPCQPFSSAGSRKGIHDDRGSLFEECIRVIEDKKPIAFVFENVRGILSTNYSKEEKLVDHIIERLKYLNNFGYKCKFKLLNSSDYDVPQNRYRVFIIGLRNDLDKVYQFPDFVKSNKLQVRNIINIPKNAKNHEHWCFSPQAKLMVEHIPEGGSWKNVPYEVLPPRFKKIRDNIKFYKSPNFYRRFARNEINGTITASAQPENCGIIHPLENRRYTIREIARIQSFPDNFIFETTSITNSYKVIGNAVPPNLAKHIAIRLDEIINDKFKGHLEPEQIGLFDTNR